MYIIFHVHKYNILYYSRFKKNCIVWIKKPKYFTNEYKNFSLKMSYLLIDPRQYLTKFV